MGEENTARKNEENFYWIAFFGGIETHITSVGTVLNIYNFISPSYGSAKITTKTIILDEDKS